MSAVSTSVSPPTTRGGRQARRNVVVVLLIVVIAGAAAWFLRGARADAVPVDFEFAAGVDVPASGMATLATMEIPNPDGLSMAVEKVSLPFVAGVELIGATVVTPADRAAHGSYDAGPQFPPEGWPYPMVRKLTDVIPIEEFTGGAQDLPSTLKLNVGVRAQDTGVVAFNGVDVTYRLDGRRRTMRFPHALLLCTPPTTCADVDTGTELVHLGLLQR